VRFLITVRPQSSTNLSAFADRVVVHLSELQPQEATDLLLRLSPTAGPYVEQVPSSSTIFPTMYQRLLSQSKILFPSYGPLTFTDRLSRGQPSSDAEHHRPVDEQQRHASAGCRADPQAEEGPGADFAVSAAVSSN
jgi:hypothetical protein